MAAVAVFGLSNVGAQEADAPAFGFEKGNIILEGSLGLYSENDKNTEEKVSGFSLNPKAGYFVTEDFAVGLELGIGSYKEELAGTDTEKQSSFAAGVFGRYYFLDLGKRFKTFAEVGVGFGTVKYDLADVKEKFVGAGVGLGINYFVKENIAITFNLSDVLSYTSRKWDVDGAEAVSEFNANINVLNNFFETAQFGLMYKF